MSELVESALRAMFREEHEPRQLPELPTFDSGGHKVDIADREALQRVMEGE